MSVSNNYGNMRNTNKTVICIPKLRAGQYFLLFHTRWLLLKNFTDLQLLKQKTTLLWQKIEMLKIWKSNTRFFIRKPFFCLSLNFLDIMLEIRLRFFLTFISLFSLIVYLVTFNTKNKLYFLTYILIRMSNSTQYKKICSS